MKNLVLLTMLLISGLYAAQVSVFAAQSSKDPAVVQAFIAANPKHPKVPELKKKLSTMSYTVTTSGSGNDAEAKPKVSKLTASKVEKNINKSKTSENAEKTAAILTNLFNDNRNSKEAVLQIVNRSACELVIKVSGKKKFYNLSVPSKNQNYILIEKGTYNLTTSICGASYTSNKSINASTIITLGNK
ncbi:hypothetical protein G6R40_12930 [Chryseobacterium sp. POL2]|uniref:DUF6759 domain-containing protein n=1 Tax=Chryseobacterium sp. POL2 TaxID=2713414 RepID=UPI0013E1A56B|nr:DUF6759 domain-containing protein [Chryseobacterium sp. POL2]QIG90501.1 hypothetical protein G6R40_12930 [Chryseobacterium sp. POL2]